MAGMPSERATIAVCEVTPPTSVTKPPKWWRLNRIMSAGERSCATTIRFSSSEIAGGLSVWLNVGEAPAVKRGAPPVPLTCRFRQADGPEGLRVLGPVVGVAVSDVDNDHDVDLVVLRDGARPQVVYNDRLLRFHRDRPFGDQAARWNGALVLNVNHDERPGVLLVPAFIMIFEVL